MYLAYFEREPFQKGRMIGIEEGKVEGRVEGKEEARLDIARNMLGEGVAWESIAKYTGLTFEEIQKLSK